MSHKSRERSRQKQERWAREKGLRPAVTPEPIDPWEEASWRFAELTRSARLWFCATGRGGADPEWVLYGQRGQRLLVYRPLSSRWQAGEASGLTADMKELIAIATERRKRGESDPGHDLGREYVAQIRQAKRDAGAACREARAAGDRG